MNEDSLNFQRCPLELFRRTTTDEEKQLFVTVWNNMAEVKYWGRSVCVNFEKEPNGMCVIKWGKRVKGKAKSKIPPPLKKHVYLLFSSLRRSFVRRSKLSSNLSLNLSYYHDKLLNFRCVMAEVFIASLKAVAYSPSISLSFCLPPSIH